MSKAGNFYMTWLHLKLKNENPAIISILILLRNLNKCNNMTHSKKPVKDINL